MSIFKNINHHVKYYLASGPRLLGACTFHLKDENPSIENGKVINSNCGCISVEKSNWVIIIESFLWIDVSSLFYLFIYSREIYEK